MMSTEETITLSPYSVIYELVVPKDNILRHTAYSKKDNIQFAKREIT